MSYYRPIQLATILAQPHPEIDLKLETYEKKSRALLATVSSFTSRAIDEIMHRKDEQDQLLKREAEKRKLVEAEVNECKVKELELMKVLQKEQEERRDAEAVVGGLKRNLAMAKEKSAAVDVEIQQYASNIWSLQNEKMRDRAILDNHSRQVGPALAALEDRLKFRIEGVKQDLLLFRFTHIDSSNHLREFSFVLDVSRSEYQVKKCSPTLPQLPVLLQDLNNSRNVYHFVHAMRQAFAESVSHLAP